MMKILRRLWESGTGTPYGQIKNRVPSHVDNRFWLPQYFIKQILIVTIIKFQGRKIMNPGFWCSCRIWIWIFSILFIFFSAHGMQCCIKLSLVLSFLYLSIYFHGMKTFFATKALVLNNGFILFSEFYNYYWLPFIPLVVQFILFHIIFSITLNWLY